MMLGIRLHGAELEHVKLAAPPKLMRRLAVDDRRAAGAAGEFDERGDDEHGEAENQQAEEGAGEIEGAFIDGGPAGEGIFAQAQDGQAVQLADGHVAGETGEEEVGDDAEVHGGLLKFMDDAAQLFAVFAGEGDEDAIGAGALDEGNDLIDRADNGDVADHFSVAGEQLRRSRRCAAGPGILKKFSSVF